MGPVGPVGRRSGLWEGDPGAPWDGCVAPCDGCVVFFRGFFFFPGGTGSSPRVVSFRFLAGGGPSLFTFFFFCFLVLPDEDPEEELDRPGAGPTRSSALLRVPVGEEDRDPDPDGESEVSSSRVCPSRSRSAWDISSLASCSSAGGSSRSPSRSKSSGGIPSGPGDPLGYPFLG